MDPEGANDDCYFYYYSSCTKGDDCPFRHCQAALGTETVCSSWREGLCFRSNCKFRHMESRINRSTIPCYWENQPGGCRKPHCVFLHQRSRYNISSSSDNKKLILPVSNNSAPPSSVIKDTDAKEKTCSISDNSYLENYSNHSDDVNVSPQPVEPFVVSFDEGEESDSESVSSTPVKFPSDLKNNSVTTKKNISEFLSGKQENFGVKTLEQLRMEKIHKESEHFYKSDDVPDIPSGVNRTPPYVNDKKFAYSAYDSPSLINPSHLETETACYPEVGEFITLSEKLTEDSLTIDSIHTSSDAERDLRSRLLKRKGISSYPEKDAVAPKKSSTVKISKEAPLDFKVKTLDEIRKEKGIKAGTTVKNSSVIFKRSIDSLPAKAKSHSNIDVSSTSGLSSKRIPPERPVNKIKIKRKSHESFLNDDTNQIHLLDEIKDNVSQMVLHDVQNISEDQNKSEIGKVKRKETDYASAGRYNKFLKSTVSSGSSSTYSQSHILHETVNSSVNGDGAVKKLRRPLIRRSLGLPSLSSTSKPSLTLKSPKENKHEPIGENHSTSPNNSISPITRNTSLPDRDHANTFIVKDNSVLSPVIKTKLLEKKSPSINEQTLPEKTDSLFLAKTIAEDVDSKALRSSVDELESFLNDTDMNLEDVEETSGKESDDILLEIEQLLDS